jgi:nucleotide-binding universal stress UspA family protein
MSNQIVVGYDGSPSSNAAVSWAAAEAAARGSVLRIVACCDFPMMRKAGAAGWMVGDMVGSVVDATRDAVVGLQQAMIDRHSRLVVNVEVSTGAVRDSLLFGLLAGDVLVVGSSSHDGAAGFWLGGTSRWATRHSPCAVVVVRGHATHGRPDRIVVGIDGSASADAALLWAADEANLQEAELVVVHSWTYAYLGVDTHAEQVRDLTRIDAAGVLDRAVELARERCTRTVKDLLLEGGAVTMLLDSVRDGDVLVLGSSGHGVVASGLIGSTVNSVIEQAAVPVVVVRPRT